MTPKLQYILSFTAYDFRMSPKLVRKKILMGQHPFTMELWRGRAKGPKEIRNGPNSNPPSTARPSISRLPCPDRFIYSYMAIQENGRIYNDVERYNLKKKHIFKGKDM